MPTAQSRGINRSETDRLRRRVEDMRLAETKLSQACREHTECLGKRIEARRRVHIDLNTATTWLAAVRAGLKQYEVVACAASTTTAAPASRRMWPLDGQKAQAKLKECQVIIVSELSFRLA